MVYALIQECASRRRCPRDLLVRAHLRHSREARLKFRVTGGADGISGIEVAGRRYEPGDEIDLTGSKHTWLVEQGYLEAVASKGSASQTDTATEEEA